MRDGAVLKTEISRPGPGSYPVVLSRAYSSTFFGDVVRFNQAGYVCVGQQTRGDGGSDGTRFIHDAQDGYDCIDWISEQSWCDGNVAMYGKSYWGATQWLAALEQHPNSKAIIPQTVNPDHWRYGYRAFGAVTLAMTAHGRAHPDSDPGWDYYMRLPLIDLDVIGKGEDDPLWKAYISHSSFDDYWARISLRADGADGKYGRIRIPVYIMDGWYDYYSGASFEAYRNLCAVGATDEIRIIVNPTDHLNRIPGDRDFGPNAAKDEIGLAIRWLDHVIRGRETGVEDEPPIKIFVMGANEWRYSQEWPPAGTQVTKYYFSSPQGDREGILTTTTPGSESPTHYRYDPDDPCPTLGASHSWCWGNNPLVPVGPYDQSSNGQREDVLVFRTPVLEADLEVVGPISIKLYASTDAVCTDFVGQLIDECPDGRCHNLIESIIRARFRESIYEPPKPLVPGRIYEYNLDLQVTANVFKRGHRIRVHLSSSMFPLWDRNPNTGHPIGKDTEVKVAHQTVYHDRLHPSHILLPVAR